MTVGLKEVAAARGERGSISKNHDDKHSNNNGKKSSSSSNKRPVGKAGPKSEFIKIIPLEQSVEEAVGCINKSYNGNGDDSNGNVDDSSINDNDLKSLSLDAIKKALPPEVFVKSLRRSVQWMIWDMAVVVVLLYLTKQLYQFDIMTNSNSIMLLTLFMSVKAFIIFVLWMLTGFFMWCVFVVGHDCGHNTFSEYKSVNLIFGLISHGSLLVPFTAWARSHRLHHLGHNHYVNDFSYPWSHDPAYDSDAEKFFERHKLFRGLFPVFGYLYYLATPTYIHNYIFTGNEILLMIGVDGCHYFPNCFKGDNMWKDADTKDLIYGWVSTAVVASYLYFYVNHFIYDSVAEFLVLFLVGPWLIFCWFLFTITYLQHHGPDTKIYDDSTWKFTLAAFETVDRNYGHYINLLHHHISDCHVVHHLFFTKIPHYNLRKATDAMVEYLSERHLLHFYKCEETPDFFTRVFKYVYQHGTRATLITTSDQY